MDRDVSVAGVERRKSGGIRKVNFKDTWQDSEVIRMYKQLKAVVDEGLKAKKEGRVKRVCLRREHEDLVRQVFLKKRGVTFRNDTGSCEQSPQSSNDVDPDWKIKGWFDAAKCAVAFLKPDYKKATSAHSVLTPNGQVATPRAQHGKKRSLPSDRPEDNGPASASSLPRSFSVPATGLHLHVPGALVQELQQMPPIQLPKAPQPAKRQEINAPAPGPVKEEPPSHCREHQQPAGNSQITAQAQQPCSLRLRAEILYDSSLSQSYRVPVDRLTSAGASRLVEDVLRAKQPGAVHKSAHHNAGKKIIAEGLTGKDLTLCVPEDLCGILQGPRARRLAVMNAIHELLALGGLPRPMLDGWAKVPLSQPLP